MSKLGGCKKSQLKYSREKWKRKLIKRNED